jgi:Uncharacterized protein conserved in bacteria (DUF2188)
MASRNQHVVPHGDKWAVRSEGSERFTSVFDTKQEAIDNALEIARRSGTEMLVHGRNGQVFRSVDSPVRLNEQTIRKVVREFARPSVRRQA